MCVYCACADWAFGWLPDPAVPYSYLLPNAVPAVPATPWTREQLEGFLDILSQIKKMEDKLGGCPCEDPGKLDYLQLIKNRLDEIDRKIDAQKSVQQQPTTTTYSDILSKLYQNGNMHSQANGTVATTVSTTTAPLSAEEAERLTKDNGTVFIGGMTTIFSPKG